MTHELAISISLDELRDGCLAIVEALRADEQTHLSNEHTPIVHAYLLGTLMRALGIVETSIPVVLEFVNLGYADYEAIWKGNHDDDDDDEDRDTSLPVV